MKLINCKEGSSARIQLPKSQSGRATRRSREYKGLDHIGILRILTHRVSIGVIDKRIETLIHQLTHYHTVSGSDQSVRIKIG